MIYDVSEIFYSIQGEGHNSGKPAIFVRFAGCNLECPFCDTDHSKNLTIDEAYLVKSISDLIPSSMKSEPPMIVLTGGEPTIQNLSPIINAIRGAWPCVWIGLETNGTNPKMLRQFARDCGMYYWITVSPKSGYTKDLGESVAIADELKCVYRADHYWESFTEVDVERYIQPCSEDFKPAVEYVKSNPGWRLSVQIHKTLKIQ